MTGSNGTMSVETPIPSAVWSDVAQLLVEAFPEEERGDVDTIRQQINQGSRRLWTNDERTGLAITCDLLTDRNDVLLEFLAVDGGRRSHGIGSDILRDVVTMVGGPIVLEVEDPTLVDTDEAQRRIRFYQRLGGVVITGAKTYGMPNLVGVGIVPMWLIEMDPVRAEELQHHINFLRSLITAIWIRAYGRAKDDEDLVAIIESLRSSIE